MLTGLFHFIPKEADHFFCGVISYSFSDELYYFLVDIKFIFIRFPFLRRTFGKKHLNFIINIVRVIKRTIRDMEVMMKILMALKPVLVGRSPLFSPRQIRHRTTCQIHGLLGTSLSLLLFFGLGQLVYTGWRTSWIWFSLWWLSLWTSHL